MVTPFIRHYLNTLSEDAWVRVIIKRKAARLPCLYIIGQCKTFVKECVAIMKKTKLEICWLIRIADLKAAVY
jgi:hypothetical protein